MERNEFFIMSAAALASNSTGDKATLAIPCKCEVLECAVKWEGSSTHATDAVIAFDKRPTAGSDTDRGDADVGEITKTAENMQGKVQYDVPATRVELEPGEEVVVDVTTANGDACAFQAWIKVREIPESRANLTNMVASA